MNENIPIATLSGITSLTNLLPELPLPCPVSYKKKNCLLESPRIADEATKVLTRPDSTVIHQIAQALRNGKSTTSTNDQLVLNDEFKVGDTPLSMEESSVLLQTLLTQAPDVFGQENDATQEILEELLGIPALCHPPVSPQLSPHQPMPMQGSPMYAGSPPGIVQAHSPYNQAMHNSPPGVKSPQQGYSQVPQAFSPHRGVPANVVSPGHQGPFVNTISPLGHMSPAQGNITPQTFSPVKTRRMRQNVSQTVQLQHPTIPPSQSVSQTLPRAAPRSRQMDPSIRRNLSENIEYMHQTAHPSNTQEQSSYNSISALEALASRNGFSLPTSSLENTLHLTTMQNLDTKGSHTPIQKPVQSISESASTSFSESTRERRSRSKPPAVEIIDLNSKFGVHSLDDNPEYQDNIPSQQQQTSMTVETISEGVSKPVSKRRSRSSSQKSVEEPTSNNEIRVEPEILMDKEIATTTVIREKDTNANSDAWTNLSSVSDQHPVQSSRNAIPDMIDLNESVEVINVEKTLAIPTRIPSTMCTPLKELQLCIPKLVITKIRERRGSKEFETHSVRAVIPGNSECVAKKKRRRCSEDSIKDQESDVEQVQPKKKRKTKSMESPDPTDIESLMESATFKRFSTALENLFEFDDECGVSYTTEIDDEEPPSESLASRTEISELYTETAKLKSLGVIHQVPTDQLLRLLSIMERHIRDGILLRLNNDQDDDDEQKLWRDLCLDRMIRAAEGSLVVLNVLTAPNIPKQLYLEEVMDRIIRLIKFHLQNNIFPEYDPIYRDPDAKDGCVFIPKSKRSKSSLPKIKLLTAFYNKMCELVSQLGDLVDVQTLTDTTILQVSSLGTAPFFVENISDLQHSSLKLVRSVFGKYVKHRDLILEDIFTSLARLPSSKRNMRSYRLNGEESIQMVTALVLQLIQCSVKIPDKTDTEAAAGKTDNGELAEEETVKVDRDILICNSYENALRTAQNFLSMFLNKCSSVSKDEEDYRPLFENFLQDLLLMLNKPEWPSAEVLLTLLGKLLIVTFNNKSLDVSLRVSAIDYLGVVAAHLRKDGVTSQKESESITDMLVDLLGDTSDESGEEFSKWDERSSKRIKVLQKALSNYLTVEGQNDPALLFAKKFYLAQWIRDTQIDLERVMRTPSDLPSDTTDFNNTSVVADVESLQKLEEEKEMLHNLLDDRLTNIRSSHNTLDYEKALLTSRYLGSSRSFSKSFDGYLGQILRILNENVVAIRTKAMKALSSVVFADPSILSRDDMQKGVHNRLVDISTSVREAAVELIGRFVLNKPELIHQYYNMIVERILDTGISVRKRVIKILKDICINQPDFPKVTEICVKIIRRISDEEGIKELVTKVCQQMWFTPEKGIHQEVLLKRVVQMTEVVTACGENTDWFEQLLENLLKSDEDSIARSSEKACKQIVNCLVENVLRQEESIVANSEGRGSSSQKLVASLTTLYLISKIKPQLLVNYGTTLQPYLSTKCNTQGDFLIIHNVARILELVVPLMEHPSETFLASLEEDLMRLTVKHGQTVVQSCISCLGAVVNSVTHNIKLVKDYFQKYYGFLVKSKTEHSEKSTNGQTQTLKPTLLRSLFTLGLLCKHFDFEADVKPKNQSSIRDKVFAVYIYFSKHEDEEVCQKAISGLGFFCMRYAELLMKNDAKNLYQDILSQSNTSVKLKWQVLKNFQTHLLEEERRLRIQDHEWKKQSDKENLKELGDTQSGQTSAVMQVYLKNILEMFFHKQGQLRTAALTVVNLILRQGLVHPVQCVPYLIAAGTDEEQQTRAKSDQQITDIDNKYSGFVQMKALAGIKMSFELQKLTHEDDSEPIRGFRKDSSVSLLSHMYSVVRTSRQPRRSLLQSMLRMFDDHKKSKLDLQLYVTDNLAYFPYTIQEEPLFLMHRIDTMLSVTGANLLQSFKEAMLPVRRIDTEGSDDPSVTNAVEEEDETVESVAAHIPPDQTTFAEHCLSSQSCLLLLLLKEHLKELFGLSDSKCHKYSPSAPSKAYDKAVSRKPGVVFFPEEVIDYVTNRGRERSNEELAKYYCDFKVLMMQVDPVEEDSEDSNGRDSPAVDAQPVLDAEGNVVVKTPAPVKPKVKQRKPARGRKTPPVSTKAKVKPKPRKKRKKITLDGDSEDDGEEVDPDFKR